MKTLTIFFSFLLFLSCYRGKPSELPPVHLIRDMDSQPKYKAQSSSRFFADGATMQTPIPGTIQQNKVRMDDRYSRGIEKDGTLIKQSVVPVTMPGLQEGRELFNIYCSPCHSQSGDGQGIIVKRGYIPPPSFHEDRLRVTHDGYIFQVISEGLRNMPSYKHQISVNNRWLIVNYFHSLQRSQNAKLTDIPEEIRPSLK
jgi:hypothetical protein